MSKYHLVGIGGIGMSALAHLLLEKQQSVSGSDKIESRQTKALSNKGAKVLVGHDASHISQDHTVVFSSAVKSDNPEYLRALELECRLIHRSQLLAELMKGSINLAVAGSHGKTTTSSLLSHVFMHAKLDPSYALGGLYQGCNGRVGQGKHFIFEADESDGTFEAYTPDYAIVTNLDHEHLEHYGDFLTLQQAFARFCKKVRQKLVYCKDDPHLNCEGISYGFSPNADVQIVSCDQNGFEQQIVLQAHAIQYHYSLPLIGRHNALNSAAVFTLAFHLGIEPALIFSAFKTFGGIGRRMELKKDERSILRFDDYAHHPTEIKTTLEGCKRAAKERRLVVLFQPHRFTRTKAHLAEFAKAFNAADLIYVTDIYSAGEEPIEGFSIQDLVTAIQEQTDSPCYYLPKDDWVKLNTVLQPHDVFVSMGAGDVTTVHNRLDPQKKLRIGVVFGGRSCEHAISIQTAKFVLSQLDSSLYSVQPFYITTEGKWALGEQEKSYPMLHETITSQLDRCDLFFPLIHGPNGEDGTIQGMFEMLQRPYVGCHLGACAIATNKMQAKHLALIAGVKTPKACAITKRQWEYERETKLEQIDAISFPCYVKPNHLGSSVGISKVTDKARLEDAIEYAFRFDTIVLVEEAVENARELEFAVIGNTNGFGIKVPSPGEKLAQGCFVDYQLKYSSKAVATTTTPTLSEKALKIGQAAALAVYEAIGCCGMSRVDFLLDQNGQWWFFEINSIPGMQALSLFPKIWQREGVEPNKLMDQLIIYAMDQNRMRQVCG